MKHSLKESVSFLARRLVLVAMIAVPLALGNHYGSASVMLTGFVSQKPLGIETLNNPVTPTGFTLPAGTTHAMISVRTAGVMFRDDGGTLNSTTGFFMPAGTVFFVNNDPKWLAAMRFRCSADGACVVYASYYRNRKPTE